MLRLLSIAAVLAACTAPPQRAIMPKPVAMVAEQSASGPATDSPAAAAGRRILSTAFVRVGPGSHLTVELHDGRVLVLRDVVMRPADYCGVQIRDSARVKYCGGYAEVAAARPGGAPATGQPDAIAPAKPAREA